MSYGCLYPTQALLEADKAGTLGRHGHGGGGGGMECNHGPEISRLKKEMEVRKPLSWTGNLLLTFIMQLLGPPQKQKNLISVLKRDLADAQVAGNVDGYYSSEESESETESDSSVRSSGPPQHQL